MSISSPGIGSGIDISSLITQLVAAEGETKANRLNLREAEYQADISAYGSLKGALSLFQTAVQDLQDVADFQVRSATSSDPDIFTVTADQTADISQYGIEVIQLAQAHKLVTSAGYADTDVIGEGALTLTQGVESFSVTVSATDTLTDVRDSINAATDNTGLTASVINVDDGIGGTQQKLVLTSTSTGLDNVITIVATDANAGDGFDLTRLETGGVNFDTPSLALDGQIKVDNQLVSSSNNTFADVIEGITINAVAIGAGETLSVAHDEAAVTFKIDTFIANYNGLVDSFNALGSYNAATESGGILLGDSVLRGVQTSIRREISASVSGLTSSFSTLAELGITTDDTGKLSLDKNTLNSVLETGFDELGQLFSATNGIANKLDSIIEGYIGSGGIIANRTLGLESSINDITDQREALDRRLISIESRLLLQFTAMDVLVSSLQTQSSFLTQQLANLPGAFGQNRN